MTNLDSILISRDTTLPTNVHLVKAMVFPVVMYVCESWTVKITTNCENLFKRWEYQTTWNASWEICMQVKKQQLEPDMEQETVSKSGKLYVKVVYCHPVYLTYMQSTSWEMLGWMKYGIKIAGRNINNLRYADDTTLMAESEEESKNSWWKWKRRVKKLA